MPRTRLDKRPNEKLATLVNGYVYRFGGTPKSASVKLKKDYRTLCRKLNDPGTFSVNDLLHFCRVFNVPIDELRAAIEK